MSILRKTNRILSSILHKKPVRPEDLFELADRTPPKGWSNQDRFREIISDPLNLAIKRCPGAGLTKGDYVILHNGNIVKIKGANSYYGDFSEILALNRGVHEPLEEFVFQQVLESLKHDLQSPVTMLELGAYWGHYSMWLQQVCPDSLVVLVEPSKQNLECGKYNFATNGYRGEFIQSSVGETSLQVDHFMENRSIQKLTILHSDIQGYEDQMLRGAARALEEHRIDHVFLSTHSDDLHSFCAKYLSDSGYAILVTADVSTQTTSCDGFIYATTPDLAPRTNLPQKIYGRTELAHAMPEDLISYASSLRVSLSESD